MPLKHRELWQLEMVISAYASTVCCSIQNVLFLAFQCYRKRDMWQLKAITFLAQLSNVCIAIENFFYLFISRSKDKFERVYE
jgi:hypothetical protein